MMSWNNSILLVFCVFMIGGLSYLKIQTSNNKERNLKEQIKKEAIAQEYKLKKRVSNIQEEDKPRESKKQYVTIDDGKGGGIKVPLSYSEDGVPQTSSTIIDGKKYTVKVGSMRKAGSVRVAGLSGSLENEADLKLRLIDEKELKILYSSKAALSNVEFLVEGFYFKEIKNKNENLIVDLIKETDRSVRVKVSPSDGARLIEGENQKLLVLSGEVDGNIEGAVCLDNISFKGEKNDTLKASKKVCFGKDSFKNMGK